MLEKREIAQKIDHTLLNACATQQDIKQLCYQAKDNDFFSVCVNPFYVPLAKKELSASTVKVCAVVAFPLGALPCEIKLAEVSWLLQQGVDEIDMVINLGAFKSNCDDPGAREEISAIKEKMGNKVLKVIIETCYLKDWEIKKATQIVLESGADFVKTSTGFGREGANEAVLKLMLEVARGTSLKVKAAGGIKTINQLEKYLSMGVERIGTSSALSLLKGYEVKGY